MIMIRDSKADQHAIIQKKVHDHSFSYYSTGNKRHTYSHLKLSN